MTSPAVKAMIADLCAAADRYDRMHPRQTREWLVIADATPRFVTLAGEPERMAGPTENGPETVRQHHVSRSLTPTKEGL